jgi:hypothetical protein
LAVHTRVEAEFCLDGLRFRLAGAIKAAENQQTAGIRFLDVSPRKHEQLEQLIRGLRKRGGRKRRGFAGAVKRWRSSLRT